MGDVIGFKGTAIERRLNWETMRMLKENIYDMQVRDRDLHKDSIDKHQEAFEFYLAEYVKPPH
jgi:hypothetical protein